MVVFRHDHVFSYCEMLDVHLFGNLELDVDDNLQCLLQYQCLDCLVYSIFLFLCLNVTFPEVKGNEWKTWKINQMEEAIFSSFLVGLGH